MILYLYRKWRRAVTRARSFERDFEPEAGPPLARWIAIGAVVALATSALMAQWRAPRPQRTTPRAVAVLESDANGSQRLLPVTFYYEGHYYDAALYRATPVPFVLAPETVYEVQRFGAPAGTFTVRSAAQPAIQSAAQNADQDADRSTSAWFGYGLFRARREPPARAKNKPPARVAIEDPTRPVLHRRAGSEGDRPAPKGGASADEHDAAADEDPERPRLHRSASAEDGASGSSGSAPVESGAGAEKSGGAAAGQASAHASDEATKGAAPPPAEAASDRPERPVLRRRKSGAEQGGRDLPSQDSSQRSSQSGGLAGTPEQNMAKIATEQVTRQAAVSDAGPSEARSLLFSCPEAQRQQMEAQASAMGQSELARLGPMRHLKPAQGATALEDEQFALYDLDYNEYATVVFSARFQGLYGTGSQASGSKNAPTEEGGRRESWVVTVVTRQDSDKLVRLYSAVSDPRELDLYPELRLVDAVDPDGYGRFALLFREQKRDGASWLLGRVTGYELQTVFETAPR